MNEKTYAGRKRFSKCVRCGEFVEGVKHATQRAMTGFLTTEQVSNLDAQLAEEFEPQPDGGFDYIHVEDTCPTCIVQLMAANV